MIIMKCLLNFNKKLILIFSTANQINRIIQNSGISGYLKWLSYNKENSEKEIDK